MTRRPFLVGLGILVVVVAAILAFFHYGFGRVSDAGTADMVWDDALLLNTVQRDFVARYHRVLLTDFDIDLRVLSVKGQADVAQAAAREFAARKVGSRSRTGRGLLLLIAPEANMVRLEVAQALEPVFTDTFVAYIQQRQMLPFFKSGRVADGMLATTELIYARAVAAKKGEDFDPKAIEATSSGGGAQTAANIGEGYSLKPLQQQTAAVQAGYSPKDTVAAYLAAMAKRDARTDLPIYSEATRQMLAKWTVTPAQMDNVARTFQACGTPDLRQTEDSQRAVLRYPVAERACSPWFLVLEEGVWRLDLTMMQHAIRFNHRNEWHFVPGASHPYAEAFADLQFDNNGFPHERRRQRWSLSLRTSQVDGRQQTMVTYVGAGSAAERMGFRVGDRLIKMQEVEIAYAGQASKQLDSVKEGEAFTATIERNGQQLTLRMAAPPTIE